MIYELYVRYDISAIYEVFMSYMRYISGMIYQLYMRYDTSAIYEVFMRYI